MSAETPGRPTSGTVRVPTPNGGEAVLHWRLPDQMSRRWLFSKRLIESRKAWESYREVVTSAPEEMPALFSAGFTLGVVAAQAEKPEPLDDRDRREAIWAETTKRVHQRKFE